MPEYDVVIIPGGGVREGGVLPPWVAARFDLALAVCGDALLMPLSFGTPHRPPPLDRLGYPIVEAMAGARYLMDRQIDPARILLEASSYDTIGNAYFARTIHFIPRGFQRALVITSEFHMPRTEAVFRWVFGLEAPGTRCSLDFLTSPDAGIDGERLKERVERERTSLIIFRDLQTRVGSLAGLHDWLFTKHGVYAPQAGPPLRSAVDASTY
jgi:uncharacterized SAM-binding protein YcdF (DUF218 family)